MGKCSVDTGIPYNMPTMAKYIVVNVGKQSGDHYINHCYILWRQPYRKGQITVIHQKGHGSGYIITRCMRTHLGYHRYMEQHCMVSVSRPRTLQKEKAH